VKAATSSGGDVLSDDVGVGVLGGGVKGLASDKEGPDPRRSRVEKTLS
jgi:hypothetical protein